MNWIQQYWIEVLFGAIATGLVTGFRMMSVQFKAIKAGMQAMLRNQIIGQYNKYTDKGHIPIYGLENVEAMYVQYHALGGNGTITRLVEELRELPTKGKTGEDPNDEVF